MGKQEGANYSKGMMGFMKAKEDVTKFNQEQISGAFQDLDSLQEKSRQMVAIAEKIKSALAKHELDEDSEEMKEIQKVMFNMGIVSDFSTQVSKDTSGKNYHSALAYEIEKFLDSIIQ